jgi:hypothetical protein
LKSNEIQLKKKGMEIVAQCIENMLITSISHEYGVRKKNIQLQKNTNPDFHHVSKNSETVLIIMSSMSMSSCNFSFS